MRGKLRCKGKSLLTFPTDFTVVDLETTGMNARSCSILEVACVKYRGGAEVGKFTTLVKPEGNGRVPRCISELTGITTEMVADAPSFASIAEETWNFLEGELIVGHNVNFDVNFLYDAFETILGRKLQNDFVDTYRIARRILPDLEHRRLVDLCDHFGIQTIHHRALADCDSTRQVLEKLRQTAEERGIDVAGPIRRKYSRDGSAYCLACWPPVGLTRVEDL